MKRKFNLKKALARRGYLNVAYYQTTDFTHAGSVGPSDPTFWQSIYGEFVKDVDGSETSNHSFNADSADGKIYVGYKKDNNPSIGATSPYGKKAIIKGFIVPETNLKSIEIGTMSDDGTIVTFDGVKVIDNWNYQSPTLNTATISGGMLAGSIHTIEIEYFENRKSEVQFTINNGEAVLPGSWFYPYLEKPDEDTKVDIEVPTDGSGTNQPSIAISGTTEIGNEVVEVYVYDDDTTAEPSFGLGADREATPDASGNWSLLSEFDISSFAYGPFIIYAITKDIYGNEATDKHTIYKLENNLFVSADDTALEIYVNSGMNLVILLSDLDGNSWDKVSKTYVENVGTSPFVAAKAVDTGKVVVGFNLVLRDDNGGFVETNESTWYYYDALGEPADYGLIKWHDEAYVGNGWVEVSNITKHPAWVEDSEFPSGALNNEWIWSDENGFLESGGYNGPIKSPIYLRSAPPKELYLVNFNSDGGTEVVPNPQSVIEGDKAIKPTDPTKDFYTFNGWYEDLGDDILSPDTFFGIDGYSKNVIASDVDLIAKWTPIQEEPDEYAFEFLVYPGDEAEGSITSPVGVVTEIEDEFVPVVATPAAGYRFVKWWAYFEQDFEQSFVSKSKTEAYFEPILKPITDITTATASLEVDLVLNAVDLDTQDMYPSQTEITNRLYAEFELIPPTPTPNPTRYTLTVNVVGEGSVASFEGTNSFASGTNVNLAAVVDNPLYEFVGWSGDLVSTNLNGVVVITSNKTVTATFVLIEEEPVPEAPVIVPEPVPEPEPIIEEVLLDEETAEELPETSGIPFVAFALFGASFVGLGAFLKKKL